MPYREVSLLEKYPWGLSAVLHATLVRRSSTATTLEAAVGGGSLRARRALETLQRWAARDGLYLPASLLGLSRWGGTHAKTQNPRAGPLGSGVLVAFQSHFSFARTLF